VAIFYDTIEVIIFLKLLFDLRIRVMSSVYLEL